MISRLLACAFAVIVALVIVLWLIAHAAAILIVYPRY